MKIREIIEGKSNDRKIYHVFHHFLAEDLIASRFVRQYLEESGKRRDFGQGRSVVFHRAHIPDGQDHLHFFLRQQELYALNRDGTAHDTSHGAQLHRWAMDAIKQNYDGFRIPPKGLIESSLLKVDAGFLLEAYVFKTPLVPLDAITAAEKLVSIQGEGEQAT
jgi:hypothetical protein